MIVGERGLMAEIYGVCGFLYWISSSSGSVPWRRALEVRSEPNAEDRSGGLAFCGPSSRLHTLYENASMYACFYGS